MIGKPAPEIEGKDVDGKTVRLSDLKGKVVLVDFWATWCMPCLAELPRVREAYAKYHEKGLEVLGVSNDSEVDALTKYVTENNLPWVQILDKPEPRTRATMTSGFGIFLIDKKGNCRSVTGSENMDELIPKLLAE
jgi:peroxiredoxin